MWYNMQHCNKPISQISQCIRQISLNAPFCTRNVCTFLVQNGALWDRGLVHCGIWAMSLLLWQNIDYVLTKEAPQLILMSRLWGVYCQKKMYPFTGINLCMRPANEKRHYIVTLSLIGWAHTQIDPCFYISIRSHHWYKVKQLVPIAGHLCGESTGYKDPTILLAWVSF